MAKMHPIRREADRLVAGRRHRSFRVDVRGAALDLLEALEKLAALKGIDGSGLMSLLLLMGHRTVTSQLTAMPDQPAETPKA